MKSIKSNAKKISIIKKSKFIAHLYKVNKQEDINKILETLKKEYKDSTHICYAYIINGLEKCSDDGEPSKTAGLPILNILKKNDLTNVLGVVVRYFGGIKLGAGGLVRAYSNSILEALNSTKIITLEEGYLIELEFDYNQVKLIDYILIDKTIIEKTYDYNIIYKFYLNKQELNFIPELEKVAIHVSIKDKALIEKN